MRTIFLILVALLGLTAAGNTASALEVQEARWGFDGKVVPYTFNLLSILVVNPSRVPFDGQLVLDSAGNLGVTGKSAHTVQPCYLGPGEARWVQFYPYFDYSASSGNANWAVSWGSGPKPGVYTLEDPKFSAPASVWVTEPQGFSFAAGTANLKRFPENLFPSTVSAMDGLHAAALDHAPRWEAARRAAFLDWVRRGGVLHLLPDAQGQEVQFSDELAALNSPLERQPFGAGVVLRHRGDREAMLRDASFLKEGPAAPTLEKGEDIALYDLDSMFFRQLASLVRAKVNWAVISWLTVFYLLAVSFGHYFWAKRLKDYRLSLIALVVGVTLFAVLFAVIGRRGQGERARVNTLAWAKALEPGRYDVMQWSNVFVTRGGVFPLTHPATHNLYSANDSGSALSGMVFSGFHGSCAVEIPLFSSSALMHRGVMDGDRTDVQVATWEADDNQLKQLVLAPSAGFPPPERLRGVWVRCNNRFYPMQMTNGRLEMTHQNGDAPDAKSFLSAEELRKVNNTYMLNYVDDASRETFVAGNCERALIADCLGGTPLFAQYLARQPASADQADLLVLADQPPGFQMQGAGLGAEWGRVVYQQTFFKPSVGQTPP